jgi:MFS family permease
VSLAAFRGLLGMAEAAAIPAGMKTIGEWFPDRERSVAVGWFNAGTSLGAVIAPVLAALVAGPMAGRPPLSSPARWACCLLPRGIGSIARPVAPYVTAEELAEIRDGQRPVPTGTTSLRAIAATAFLGHCRAALSGRTRVADLLLLDPALSPRSGDGHHPDRSVRLGAVSGGGCGRRAGRLSGALAATLARAQPRRVAHCGHCLGAV